jgi:hypothetical protein
MSRPNFKLFKVECPPTPRHEFLVSSRVQDNSSWPNGEKISLSPDVDKKLSLCSGG